MEQLNPSQNDPERFVDAGVLAERRARRAELAEAQLRESLAGAELRVAELEQVADQSARIRAEMKLRNQRELEIAALLGEAADAVRVAREAVDGEIHAREAAEAALRAERIAREAAEQTVVAERAARDAATAAIVSARVRAEGAAAGSGPAAAAVPSQPASAATPETEELLAGLATAAERLRAQARVTPNEDAQSNQPRDRSTDLGSVDQPASHRGYGGLVGRTARALRKLRSERP